MKRKSSWFAGDLRKGESRQEATLPWRMWLLHRHLVLENRRVLCSQTHNCKTFENLQKILQNCQNARWDPEMFASTTLLVVQTIETAKQTWSAVQLCDMNPEEPQDRENRIRGGPAQKCFTANRHPSAEWVFTISYRLRSDHSLMDWISFDCVDSRAQFPSKSSKITKNLSWSLGRYRALDANGWTPENRTRSLYRSVQHLLEIC